MTLTAPGPSGERHEHAQQILTAKHRILIPLACSAGRTTVPGTHWYARSSLRLDPGHGGYLVKKGPRP
eukprot:4901916-Lingulodinium_polyedra.AAC.1